MHPGWSGHEAQPPVLPDEVLHVAALVVVVEFQKDPARHAIRQLGEIVEGPKNPGIFRRGFWWGRLGTTENEKQSAEYAI